MCFYCLKKRYSAISSSFKDKGTSLACLFLCEICFLKVLEEIVAQSSFHPQFLVLPSSTFFLCVKFKRSENSATTTATIFSESLIIMFNLL